MKRTTVSFGSVQAVLWEEESREPLPLVVLLPEEDTPEEVQRQAEVFLSPAVQAAYPCRVLLPERRGGWEAWETARDLQTLLCTLEQQAEGGVDGCRIYLAGSSGAWSVASRFPSRFAAVVAVSGWADPHAARQLKFVPVWAFHSPQDEVVPVSAVELGQVLRASTRRTVMALRTSGSTCVRYTEIACGKEEDAHRLWSRVWEGAQGEETLHWLFSQNRKKQLTVTFLRPGVFRIDDYFTSSCYLVLGTEKALLIDTGMSEGDLPGLVRSLTTLPVEVAITHPHRDHMARAAAFDRVYLQEQDIEKLPAYQAQMQEFFGDTGPTAPAPELLMPLREGSKIELGGGVTVETLELPGHTAHSVVFVDDAHESVFTGDAIGSGYIALMICTLKEYPALMETYREGLLRFQRHLPRLEGYAWYGGHFIQENGCNVPRQEDYLSKASRYFLPISGEIVGDMEVLCQKLLDREITQEELLHTEEHHCAYGTAGMNFRFLSE